MVVNTKSTWARKIPAKLAQKLQDRQPQNDQPQNKPDGLFGTFVKVQEPKDEKAKKRKESFEFLLKRLLAMEWDYNHGRVDDVPSFVKVHGAVINACNMLYRVLNEFDTDTEILAIEDFDTILEEKTCPDKCRDCYAQIKGSCCENILLEPCETKKCGKKEVAIFNRRKDGDEKGK